MADSHSGPYESVKNRRGRIPTNKRPYDSFAEGEIQQFPAKTQHHKTAIEAPTPPTEPSPLDNIKKMEDDYRALLRSIISNLDRPSLEDLLVEAGIAHKPVMANVIAANRKENWRRDGINGNITPESQQFAGAHAASAPIDGSGVPSFIAQLPQHITPLTEARKYYTPYPPLSSVPTPKVTEKGEKGSVSAAIAPSTSKSKTKAAPNQVQSAPAALVATPKIQKKIIRFISTKKVGGRATGLSKSIPKKAEATKTSSGRTVKRTKYTEVETEEEQSEEVEGDEEAEELENDDTDAEESEQDEKAAAVVPLKKSKRTPLPTSNSKAAEKSKDQTMIPVGVVEGHPNVALAGFDRRMGLIFRTSRYNRDGEFVGLSAGLNRSIKRDKVDFHPVLAGLTEEELRKEILRRQTKIGYEPPPNRALTGKPGQLVV